MERYSSTPFWLRLLRAPLLAAKPPSWMPADDGMRPLYRQQWRLLTQGRVAASAVLQCNRLLYEEGDMDHPVMVLFSHDPHYHADPMALRRLGRQLYRLKEEEPQTPEEHEMAAIVRDEMGRDTDTVLPMALTQGRRVETALLMGIRAHLPRPWVDFETRPVLTHPSSPFVMWVPEVYMAG